MEVDLRKTTEVKHEDNGDDRHDCEQEVGLDKLQHDLTFIVVR